MKKNLHSLKNLTLEDIQNKVLELKKELIILNIKKVTNQNIKFHLIKKNKHQISQLLALKHNYHKHKQI
uniref:Large ribosomal subunit protein uL29c n=1 Tax=Dipterocladia arabiensis TaxID=2007176 RepID=A0A1Z1M094_9FLOR|nr:ribosomal protein L29 [Dipterocladia arabiensis]ARW59429.1 ribosomal protein L29 [Dipterocladia arabiensis]